MNTDGKRSLPELEASWSTMALRTARDGRLLLRVPGEPARSVKVVRCFPWSRPMSFISLRNDDDDELAFIADPDSLDEASRAALAEALHAAGFVLAVTRVMEVEEDFEIRRWKVETVQGPRSFQTALDAWPRLTPGGELIIEDVCGDLFSFPAKENLDEKSRRLLWAFTD